MNNNNREWTSEQYDKALRLVELPLGESPWLPLYLRAMAEVAEAKPGRIMDLGCGTGRFARLVDCCGFGDGYHGVDFSGTRIEMAREYAPGLNFTWANFFDEDLQRSFSFYDIFALLEVLEHLKSDKKLLKAIPKGKIVIASVPNYEGPGSGHVRKFENAFEVVNRYGGLIEIGQVAVYPISKEKRFFLFKGERK